MGHLCLFNLSLEWHFLVEMSKEKIIADHCFWREVMQKKQTKPSLQSQLHSADVLQRQNLKGGERLGSINYRKALTNSKTYEVM